MSSGCEGSLGSCSPNIVKGNKAILRISLMTDGVPVTDLASALTARFVAISTRTQAIAIDKNLADMQIDSPAVGTVSIPLTSIDTNIAPDRYDISIRFTWGPGDSLEWNLASPLVILKSIL